MLEILNYFVRPADWLGDNLIRVLPENSAHGVEYATLWRGKNQREDCKMCKRKKDHGSRAAAVHDIGLCKSCLLDKCV